MPDIGFILTPHIVHASSATELSSCDTITDLLDFLNGENASQLSHFPMPFIC
jgi:hypothetical protein